MISHPTYGDWSVSQLQVLCDKLTDLYFMPPRVQRVSLANWLTDLNVELTSRGARGLTDVGARQ